jgi:hypothetical protein
MHLLVQIISSLSSNLCFARTWGCELLRVPPGVNRMTVLHAASLVLLADAGATKEEAPEARETCFGKQQKKEKR